MLAEIPLAGIERRAQQLVLHSRINYAYRRQREYLEADRTWGAKHAGILRPRPVAYFSAEFGLHESMPIYSGGSAYLRATTSRVLGPGHPLVGIGLFYGQGYFRQRLDRMAGSRKNTSRPMSNSLPMELAIGKNGVPVTVQIETRAACIAARRSGALKSAAAICFCWIPTSLAMRLKIAI